MLLTFGDNMISIDGIVLDCVVRSISVSGDLIFSDGQPDTLSGSKRIPMGWNEAEITISADLLTDEEEDGIDCYARLEKIDRIFKSSKMPKFFNVANRHLSARGVRKVVFSSFSSSESSDEDIISVNISFIEFESATQKTEEGAGIGTPKDADASQEPKVDEDNPAMDEGLTQI